jgi:type VI secretion system protein ImpE
VLETIINGRYGWVPLCNLARLRVDEPTDLRDLVWTAAHLDFPNGGQTVALVPTRYVGTTAEGDAATWLARRTDWLPLGAADSPHYRGLGQRWFVFGEHEQGLLQLRDVVFSAPVVPAPGASA